MFMSMLLVSAVGRLTADVELKSGNNTSFVGFNLAVNTGYGDKSAVEYLQCILFDTAAERFIKAGAKKGSLIWLAGRLSHRSFKRKDGTEDKAMNVQVLEWGYVPSGAVKDTPDNPPKGPKGESQSKDTNTREKGKEKEFKQFDETFVDDDEDLPF
jgi:single-strand DNA-binding protein